MKISVRPSARIRIYPRTRQCDSADAGPRERGPTPAQTWRGRTSLPSPLASSPPPSPSLPPLCYPHGREFFYFLFILFILFLKFFLVVVTDLERENFFTIYNFRFSVFNPQTPRTPRALRASRAKPREEEGFFGLVPLVTHPSSIPLLGGLTPKFLSLSLQSL
jgi:hypothetical protein